MLLTGKRLFWRLSTAQMLEDFYFLSTDAFQLPLNVSSKREKLNKRWHFLYPVESPPLATRETAGSEHF